MKRNYAFSTITYAIAEEASVPHVLELFLLCYMQVLRYIVPPLLIPGLFGKPP